MLVPLPMVPWNDLELSLAVLSLENVRKNILVSVQKINVGSASIFFLILLSKELNQIRSTNKVISVI